MNIDGSMAINARNMAPGSVTLVSTLSIYSEVLFPGRMPGMKPPYFCMLSARSCGLNTIAV